MPAPSKPTPRSFAYVWDGVLLYAPRAIATRNHAHFAATLLMARDRPFALTLDDGVRRYCEVALLGPNVRRQTDSQGQPLVDILIDPDDAAYRFLHPLLVQQPVLLLPRGAVGASRRRFARLFAGELDRHDAEQLVCDILWSISPHPAPALPWDARVQAATRFLRGCIGDGRPTVAQAARAVRLSQSRFSHLFRQELGLPVREYMLWLRVRRAMRLWAQGATLSEIALGAGFYDHAHFTRTLRRMTDYAPSMLTDPRLVTRHACGASLEGLA